MCHIDQNPGDLHSDSWNIKKLFSLGCRRAGGDKDLKGSPKRRAPCPEFSFGFKTEILHCFVSGAGPHSVLVKGNAPKSANTLSFLAAETDTGEFYEELFRHWSVRLKSAKKGQKLNPIEVGDSDGEEGSDLSDVMVSEDPYGGSPSSSANHGNDEPAKLEVVEAAAEAKPSVKVEEKVEPVEPPAVEADHAPLIVREADVPGKGGEVTDAQRASPRKPDSKSLSSVDAAETRKEDAKVAFQPLEVEKDTVSIQSVQDKIAFYNRRIAFLKPPVYINLFFAALHACVLFVISYTRM